MHMGSWAGCALHKGILLSGGSSWVEDLLLHRGMIRWAKPAADMSRGRLFGCENQPLSLIDLDTVPNAFYGT